MATDLVGVAMTSDGFDTLLRSRRMCRAYLPRAVAKETVLEVLDAARRSPSAGHSQGVRFGVVTDQQQRLAVADCLGEASYREKGFRPWLSAAPVHLFVGTDPDAYRDRYSEADKTSRPEEWPVEYSVLDGGKALMTLYLAAHARDLACGYLGPHRAEAALSVVPWPTGWRFLGLVTLGYPDWEHQRPSASHARGWRELDGVVSWWDPKS